MKCRKCTKEFEAKRLTPHGTNRFQVSFVWQKVCGKCVKDIKKLDGIKI